MKTFISYATEYDLYDGYKNWSDLTSDEQDEIIRAEISVDSDSEIIIMRLGLKKKQARGLRSILIYNFMIEEKETHVDFLSLNDEQRQLSIRLLRGTAIGARLAETYALQQPERRQDIDENELESFSDLGYQYLLDLSAKEARFALHKILLPERNVRNDKPNQKNGSEFYIKRRRSIFDRLLNRFRSEHEALAALNEIRSHFDDDDFYVSSTLEYTFDSARELINKEKEKIREAMNNEGMDAIVVALKAVYHVSSNSVASGNFHIYRGVLSGVGDSYLKIAQTTLEILFLKGLIDTSERDSATEDLLKAVKDAG